MELERRDYRDYEVADTDELFVESRADGGTFIVGYAAVWNRLSLDLGGFRERILPGAFDAVLKRGKLDVKALFNHDSNMVLGRSLSGTLELSSDDKGLRYVVSPPETRADVVDLIRRRDVTGSSFAFTCKGKNCESFSTEGGQTIREIREVSGLYDVGPVLTPAYPDSSVGVAARSYDVAKRSYEEWLAGQEPEPVVQIAKRSLASDAALAAALRLRNV